MKELKNATDVADHINYVHQAGSKLHEASNKLANTTKDHLNSLKSRRIALDEEMATSARQTFPNIEPYVEPTNSISDSPSLSDQSSFLRLNVGEKHFDISRSSF